jgi:type IV pilus assembly protein PilA
VENFNITRARGFTLIELMVIVAVIAILAAIALPAYQDYLIRAQVAEGASLIDGAKTAVASFYADTGHFPSNNQSAGLASSSSIVGTYVSKLSVATPSGVIQATYGTGNVNKAILNQVLALSAVTNAGSVSWACNNTATTTLNPRYLPLACR